MSQTKLIYDTTGTDPLFKVSDHRFYKNKLFSQTLSLKGPAYKSSVIVYNIQTGIPVLLEEDVDYTFNYNNEIAGVVGTIEPGWDVPAIDDIVLTDNVPQGALVSCYYQLVEQYDIYEGYGDGPIPTPEAMKWLIDEVTYLAHSKDPIPNVSSHLNTVRALDIDLTGLNPANMIVDERHNVDVPNNVKVIIPALGAFYKHDLVLRLAANGQELIEGTDYIVYECNLAKTKLSEHPSGVYEYILILSPINGDVDMTYRAYGGAITVSDIQALRASINNITMALSDRGYITAENLGYSPIIMGIEERLVVLEDEVKHWPQTTHTLIFENNTSQHWFTIGEVYMDDHYQVPVDENIGLSIECRQMGFKYEVTTTVNTMLAENDDMIVVTDSDYIRGGYPASDVSIEEFKPVALRLVRSDIHDEGMVLQIGLYGEIGTQYILRLRNTLRSNSVFALRPSKINMTHESVGPINLPCNREITTYDADIKTTVKYVYPETGMLLFNGCIPLHEQATVSNIPGLLTQPGLLTGEHISVVIWDKIRQCDIETVLPLTLGPDGGVAHGMFYAEDLCSIIVKISNNYVTEITSHIGSHSERNLSLIHI